jgi:hypothetical protein
MSFVVLPLEQTLTKLVFALNLRDGLSLREELLGKVQVAAGGRAGWRKATSGTFLFMALPNGPATFQVRSDPDTLYYRPVDISLAIPFGSPQWPAYPDLGLADPSLALSDAGQPAAYRAQFLQSALRPSIAYPFDPSATLVRGAVTSGGVAVPDATVFDVAGDALAYVTGADGQFVLVYTAPPPVSASVTVRTQRSGHADVDTLVTVRRAATASIQVNV